MSGSVHGSGPPGLDFRILCLGAVSSDSSHHPRDVHMSKLYVFEHKWPKAPFIHEYL